MTSENRQTQLILDSIPSFVWLKDISNRILRVNQAVSTALGLPREEIEGRHAKEIYPDDAERFYEDDLAVIRSGQPRIGCRDKVGNRWLRVDKIPVHGDDGQIDRLLVIATDITELKHAEQAQDEARRLLEITGRLAELGGWNLDLPTNTLSWSEQVCLIHEVPVGYQPTVEEAIDFYVPESRERIRQHVQLAIETGKPWDEELAIRTKKGREVWVRAIGEAEVVEGECVRLWGTFQDISARKRRDDDLAKLNKQLIRRAKEAEEARQQAESAEAELATAVARLTDSEERYRTLFESSPVMHANVSPEDATIRDCNQMLVTRLGYGDKSELVGRSIHSLYSETCREKVHQAFERFVSDGEVKNASLSLVTRSGSEIPVSLNVASVRDSTGKVLYSSSTWSDVTELTKANHDLREFAYVASHDLKAPLRAISHLATWIEEDLEGAMGKSSEQHLAQLKQRILRMERLLEDLLVYSRAGRSGGSTQRVDLGELIEGVASLHGSEEHFLVCVDLAVREVEVCETPLETVLRNLVSNAIKHHDGDRKRIDIKAQMLDGSLEISVIDDGPGIPTELHDRAFRMFQTLRPRDEVEGSGMGLPLAKRLIESYGGEVKIEQAEPRGACIRFTWPIGVIHTQQ